MILHTQNDAIQIDNLERKLGRNMTITERDEAGRIVKGGKKLSSEDARDMQSKRWSKAKEDSAEMLLEQAGYTDENPAPEHLKLLAEIAASKQASAVAANRDFLKLTARTEDPSKPGRPKPGTICPTCNEMVFTGFRPTEEQLDQAADYLQHHRKYGVKETDDDMMPEPETGSPFKPNGE